jgi:P27 family predicted phage terminase small subunit
MIRGRRPTPTKLKILRGNPGCRRLNDREPQPTGDLPPCPDHLQGAAREAWHDFAAGLTGIATSLDATALELLCVAYAGFRGAMEKVASGGPVWIVPAKDGGLPIARVSPYQRLATTQWKMVREMMAEFGLTPSSRSRVQVAGPAAAGDDFDRFLARGRS